MARFIWSPVHDVVSPYCRGKHGLSIPGKTLFNSLGLPHASHQANAQHSTTFNVFSFSFLFYFWFLLGKIESTTMVYCSFISDLDKKLRAVLMQGLRGAEDHFGDTNKMT